MPRQTVGNTPERPQADPLRSNINLNKAFPFVRKFAAYSLQNWTKLDRPRQRRLQGSLLALRVPARDVPQGIGCHVLSIAYGVLARARAGPVAERLLTATPRQSGRGLGSDLGRVCNRRRLASSQLGSRAQTGAKMLYEFVTENLKRKEAGGDNAGRDGKSDRALADKDSQNTLTPADLATPWRGPAPRKDARHAV